MIKHLQLLSINILNSNYNFLFSLAIFLLILFFFKTHTAFCTNDNIPLIAEPKTLIIKDIVLPTPLQKEVSSFLNQAGIITEQNQTINKQKEEIMDLLQAKENMLSQINAIQKEKQNIEFDKLFLTEQYDIYKKGFERMFHFSLLLLAIITITYISINIPQQKI